MVKIVIVACIVIFFACGCQNQYYFQDFKASAPVNQQSLHYVDGRMTNNRFRVSFSTSSYLQRQIGGTIDKHLPVGPDGVTHYDTANGRLYFPTTKNPNIYEGTNFTWNLPKYTYSLDLNYVISDHTLLSATVNYSEVSDEKYFNQSYGIARYVSGDNFGFRMDAGFHVNWVSYSVQFLREYTSFGGDSISRNENGIEIGTLRGKDISSNFYFSFTLNTKRTDWPMNLIIQASWDRNDMLDYNFTPNTTQNSLSQATTVLNLSGGLVFPVGENVRVIAGCTFFQDQSFRNDRNPFFGMPVMQIDWSL